MSGICRVILELYPTKVVFVMLTGIFIPLYYNAIPNTSRSGVSFSYLRRVLGRRMALRETSSSCEKKTEEVYDKEIPSLFSYTFTALNCVATTFNK